MRGDKEDKSEDNRERELRKDMGEEKRDAEKRDERE